MKLHIKKGSVLCSALLIIHLFSQVALGQQDSNKPQSRDDVLRINTELVQTGVTVFDKQGRFVDGLKQDWQRKFRSAETVKQ